MGLDVYLYQFKGVNTDAILELFRFEEKERPVAREKLVSRARELGLPGEVFGKENLGGVNVRFSSKLYPKWMVGDWYSLSTTRAIMEKFTGKELYYAFPEARSSPRFFRPDWLEAKKRLTELFEALRELGPPQLDSYCSGLSQSFDHHLSQVGVMIETVDFVLGSEDPKEFLLLWSG